MTDPVEVSTSPEASREDVFERITDAVFALDEEWRFTFLNERAEELLQREGEDLLGEVVWESFPGAIGSTFQREYEHAMETQEPVAFEAFYPPLSAWFEVRAYPSETGLSVYFRDVTERVRRETDLRERERALRRAYEVVADTDRPFPEQVRALLSVVRETLGTDYATLSRVRDDEYVFEVVDAPADADLQKGDTVPLETTNCERVVATERTLVLENVEADAPELADRAGNAQWGIACYLGAPVTVDGEVYGTFCFYDMEARTEEFSDWEVTFVDLLGSWVSQELERRRYTDRLAALDDLNGVVREITEAAIDTSTREAIETAACERLAESDSYLFAWIGEMDPATRAIEVRTAAGVEGSPEGATVTVDPDGEEAPAPAGEALRTGEMQTARTDRTAHDPWRDDTGVGGYRSVAAVPIAHVGSVYGVLNVYSGRADAFEDGEASVIEHLGDVLGHAIAAVDRKQVLTSDTVVELEFRVRDAFAGGDGADPPEGRIVYEEVVPVDDGEFLVYGTADEGALASLAETDGDEPHRGELTRIGDGEGNDGVSFELRLSEPPLLSTLASLGGAIERGVVEDGDYRVTVHLPPDVAVRRVFESVHDTYPDAEVLSKQQVTRPADASRQAGRALSEELTDRQLTALRAAHAAGFFEWPREMSGEEVAASLDITSATFHQHLRAAENKLFDAVLDDSVER